MACQDRAASRPRQGRGGGGVHFTQPHAGRACVLGFHCKDQKPAENPNLFQVLGESARISRPAWRLRGEGCSGCPWALGSFPGNKSRHSDPCPPQQQRQEEPLSLWMSNVASNSAGGNVWVTRLLSMAGSTHQLQTSDVFSTKW